MSIEHRNIKQIWVRYDLDCVVDGKNLQCAEVGADDKNNEESDKDYGRADHFQLKRIAQLGRNPRSWRCSSRS